MNGFCDDRKCATFPLAKVKSTQIYLPCGDRQTIRVIYPDRSLYLIINHFALPLMYTVADLNVSWTCSKCKIAEFTEMIACDQCDNWYHW